MGLVKCLHDYAPWGWLQGLADLCVLCCEDRMIMPWHSFKTGRRKVLNHCFIEGKLVCTRGLKKPRKWSIANCCPGGMGERVCTWIQTKSVSSLFDWQFHFEKSVSRDLWELSNAAPGQKINCSLDQRGRSLVNQRPLVCGSVGLQVAM